MLHLFGGGALLGVIETLNVEQLSTEIVLFPPSSNILLFKEQ